MGSERSVFWFIAAKQPWALPCSQEHGVYPSLKPRDAYTSAHILSPTRPTPKISNSCRRLTSLDLCLVLDAVVGLAAAQEVLAAAGGLDVLNAHMDALADDAAIHLQYGAKGAKENGTRNRT